MSQLKNLMLDMEDDLVAVVEAIEKSEKMVTGPMIHPFYTIEEDLNGIKRKHHYPGGILRDVAKTKFLEKYPLAGPWFDETWKKIELSC
jgi:hypothetical protein